MVSQKALIGEIFATFVLPPFQALNITGRPGTRQPGLLMRRSELTGTFHVGPRHREKLKGHHTEFAFSHGLTLIRFLENCFHGTPQNNGNRSRNKFHISLKSRLQLAGGGGGGVPDPWHWLTHGTWAQLQCRRAISSCNHHHQAPGPSLDLVDTKIAGYKPNWCLTWTSTGA